MEDWATIVALHGGGVWQVAFRLLGNEADSADCFQETFAAAVKVSRREPVRNWPALLRRLVTMQSLLMLRQRLRRRQHLVERVGAAETCESLDPSPGPEDHAEAGEVVEALRKALAHLPRQQAAAVTLRFIEELTYEQIAETLGLTSSAVGVLIHRAKKRLRDVMETQAESGKPEVRHG